MAHPNKHTECAGISTLIALQLLSFSFLFFPFCCHLDVGTQLKLVAATAAAVGPISLFALNVVQTNTDFVHYQFSLIPFGDIFFFLLCFLFIFLCSIVTAVYHHHHHLHHHQKQKHFLLFLFLTPDLLCFSFHFRFISSLLLTLLVLSTGAMVLQNVVTMFSFR